jgi:hypothetical protein
VQGYDDRFSQALDPHRERARLLDSDGRGAEMLAPVDFIDCAETSATDAAFLSSYSPDPAWTPRV